MEIRDTKQGDVLVLAPDGNIAESDEINALETKLATALKAGSRLVVFDCGGLGLLTGAAIRVLLTTSRKLEGLSGRLVLCGMNERVTKAFSISRLDKNFVVVSGREDAVRAVREPAVPRSAPAPDRPDSQAALAAALLGALHAHVSRAEPVGGTPRSVLDEMANGVLAALRAGRS